MLSIIYFSRLASTPAYENRIGITNLAMATRMNHKRCLAMVKLLEKHGFVLLLNEGRRKEVVVTPGGIEYFKKFRSLVLPITSPMVVR
jgi:predicted transcriptional regulator